MAHDFLICIETIDFLSCWGKQRKTILQIEWHNVACVKNTLKNNEWKGYDKVGFGLQILIHQ